MRSTSQNNGRKNEKVIAHIQKYALLLWPQIGGMNAIFEKYSIDWTAYTDREIPLDVWVTLWQNLLQTEQNRLNFVLQQMIEHEPVPEEVNG